MIHFIYKWILLATYFNGTGLCNHFFLFATLPHFLQANRGDITISLNVSKLSFIVSSFHLQSRFSFFAIYSSLLINMVSCKFCHSR